MTGQELVGKWETAVRDFEANADLIDDLRKHLKDLETLDIILNDRVCELSDLLGWEVESAVNAFHRAKG